MRLNVSVRSVQTNKLLTLLIGCLFVECFLATFISSLQTDFREAGLRQWLLLKVLYKLIEK